MGRPALFPSRTWALPARYLWVIMLRRVECHGLACFITDLSAMIKKPWNRRALDCLPLWVGRLSVNVPYASNFLAVGCCKETWHRKGSPMVRPPVRHPICFGRATRDEVPTLLPTKVNSVMYVASHVLNFRPDLHSIPLIVRRWSVLSSQCRPLSHHHRHHHRASRVYYQVCTTSRSS